MLTIGTTTLSNRLILAPLAGYNDLPFRLLCREYGASLCVSEMLSCHGIVYRQQRTLAMLQTCAEERPVFFQLFGADPEIMGEAAAVLDTIEIDGIDINMGCPVKKVTKRGAGAALMTDIHRAEQVVHAVVSNTSHPVTVKMRAGPDAKTINVTEFGRMAEYSGAAAVTIHGRTWKQAFGGMADWSLVRKVKDILSIPVIGNGDVTSYTQASDYLETFRPDAIMIGRGALGNPWVFNSAGRPARLNNLMCAIRRHLNLFEQYIAMPPRSIAPLKHHLGKYFRGFQGCANLRRRLYEIPSYPALRSFFDSL